VTEAPSIYRLDMLQARVPYRNAVGVRVPSVTTIIGILDKPALLYWAWKLGQDGIDMDAARQQAANIGTVAHARVEAHVRGIPFDETGIPGEVLEKSSTAFLGFLDLWRRRRYVMVESELKMVSEKWQVGGRLDLVAQPEDAPGQFELIDIKAANAVYREGKLQACAYAAMYEEIHPGRKIHAVHIIQLPKDEPGEPTPHEVTNRAVYVEAFASLVHSYRALSRLPR
jgi:hypothetical protein